MDRALSLGVWLLSLLLAFVVGIVGYFTLANRPVVQQTLPVIMGWWQAAYVTIGITLWGLAPLTGYLAILTGGILLDRLGLRSLTMSPRKHLDFIIESGPLLGILGTMIALSEAMVQIDLSSGLQVAIRNMTVFVGQALNSSIHGISLAMIAFGLKFLAGRAEEK